MPEAPSELIALRTAAGLSVAQVGAALDLDVVTVKALEEHPEDAPVRLVRAYFAFLARPRPIDVGTPYDALVPIMTRLVEAVEGLPTSALRTAQYRLGLRRLLRKPRLAAYGPFDAGKSHLLNSLLGAPILPSSYQPATRITTFVVHESHRPKWLTEPVAVLAGNWSPAQLPVNDVKIGDLVSCGPLEHLMEAGSHRRTAPCSSQHSATAFVFHDAPVLRAVTLIDTPGFSSAAASDEHNRHGLRQADALIFMTTAAGFLKEPAPARLAEVMTFLPRMTTEGHAQAALHNLIVVASHATPSFDELSTILIAGGDLVWRTCQAQIAARVRPLKTPLHRSQLQTRFHTFLSEDPRKFSSLWHDIDELLRVRLPGFYVDFAVGVLTRLRRDFGRDIYQLTTPLQYLLESTVLNTFSGRHSVTVALDGGNPCDAGLSSW